MQDPIAGKRIVSKGEYVVKCGKKTALYSSGSTLLLFSIIAGVISCCSLAGGILALYPFALALGGLLGALAVVSGKWGMESMKAAHSLKPGIPLNRANTADLPANDSLVRASQEPAQAQQGVLLRPASGEAQAGETGQLLRASVGND